MERFTKRLIHFVDESTNKEVEVTLSESYLKIILDHRHYYFNTSNGKFDGTSWDESLPPLEGPHRNKEHLLIPRDEAPKQEDSERKKYIAKNFKVDSLLIDTVKEHHQAPTLSSDPKSIKKYEGQIKETMGRFEEMLLGRENLPVSKSKVTETKKYMNLALLYCKEQHSVITSKIRDMKQRKGLIVLLYQSLIDVCKKHKVLIPQKMANDLAKLKKSLG